MEDKRLIGYKNNELNSNKTLLGYSNNDYWYVNPYIENNLPTLDQCNGTQPIDPNTNVFLSDPYNNVIWDISCNDENFAKNQQICIKKELCKNRDYAVRTNELQFNHGGADQKYIDTNKQYISEYLNIFNLGIGIIVIIFYIFQKVNNSFFVFGTTIQSGINNIVQPSLIINKS